MIVTKYDPEIGWYEVEERLMTFELTTFKPTKIEDLEYFKC